MKFNKSNLIKSLIAGGSFGLVIGSSAAAQLISQEMMFLLSIGTGLAIGFLFPAFEPNEQD